MNFFKSFLASLLGTFVAMGLVAIFFFMGIAAVATSLNFEQSEEYLDQGKQRLGFGSQYGGEGQESCLQPTGGLIRFDSGMIGMDEILGIKKLKRTRRSKELKPLGGSGNQK